jgi:hypothetical protein
MADGYNNADYAFTLPNYFPAPGQVLQSAIARQDKQAEFDYENQMRAMQAAQKKAEDDRMKNLGVLFDETEFGNKYETSDLQINSMVQNQLQNAKNEGLQFVGESPEYFRTRLNSRASKIAQFSKAAQAHSKNAEEVKKNILSLNPNIDSIKLNSLISKSVLDNVTQLDPSTGQLTVKEASLINPNPNYGEIFNNLDVLAPLVVDTSLSRNLWKGVPISTTSDKNYTNNKGKVQSFGYAAVLTPFTKIVEDEKGFPTVVVTSEEVPYNDPKTGKIEKIKVADESLMDYVSSKPSELLSLRKEWIDEKAKTKAKYDDPAVENIMFKNFVYNQAKQFLPHEVKTQEVSKTPVIKINTGEQTSKIDYNLIKRITSSINNNDTKALDDDLGKLYTLYGGKKEYSEYKPVPGKSGKPSEYMIYLKGSDGVPLPPLSLKPGDKNLLYKVTQLYQGLTGSDKKVESKVLNEPVPKPAPKKDNTISVILDGKIGEIPEKNWEAFKKKYPNAKRQ